MTKNPKKVRGCETILQPARSLKNTTIPVREESRNDIISA